MQSRHKGSRRQSEKQSRERLYMYKLSKVWSSFTWTPMVWRLCARIRDCHRAGVTMRVWNINVQRIDRYFTNPAASPYNEALPGYSHRPESDLEVE